MEVGTLATRENLTVNNDLDVRGGATFARGFESTASSAIYSSAGAIPALILQGNGTAASTPLRLLGLPSGSGTVLAIDGSNNVLAFTSSKRFKENFRALDTDTSEGLYDLHPTIFDYKQSSSGTKDQLGFIAEEVAEVFPTIVNYDNDGIPYSIKYDSLHAPVIKELQNHNNR